MLIFHYDNLYRYYTIILYSTIVSWRFPDYQIWLKKGLLHDSVWPLNYISPVLKKDKRESVTPSVTSRVKRGKSQKSEGLAWCNLVEQRPIMEMGWEFEPAPWRWTWSQGYRIQWMEDPGVPRYKTLKPPCRNNISQRTYNDSDCKGSSGKNHSFRIKGLSLGH